VEPIFWTEKNWADKKEFTPVIDFTKIKVTGREELFVSKKNDLQKNERFKKE
jgi:hypothetical protein